LRFRSVARGGIRLIPSRDEVSFQRNLEGQFNENYNLAQTQNLKNKDIPEFGSKGTILLEKNSQGAGIYAFRKYVSGLLDVITPSKHIVDHLGEEEILFLGPDEGTAGVMEWAALYARQRGYPYWKAFTTGKPPSLGGIPHDTYGMTTRSVHQFVLGIMDKLDIQESSVRKLQIGGPDGDLGSNEIKISSDQTVGVVDGSGVLYDPNGIDRGELGRLATERSMVEEFNSKKLSEGGFFVSCNDSNITLPDGSVVENGVQFRNTFHLNPLVDAELFVPCGGRPGSIGGESARQLIRSDGSPAFKYIVEGANLFLTQEARASLEAAGAILYKDASTNKGGVSCSSMEVLAALTMTDEEFATRMRVEDDATPPAFYAAYVEEVQRIVEENARLEFECLWKEQQRTGMQSHILTDLLSQKINLVNTQVQSSTLVEQPELQRQVFAEALPTTLTDELGLDTVLNRLPDNYKRSLFGCYLASRYIYSHGMEGQEFTFFEFMQRWAGK